MISNLSSSLNLANIGICYCVGQPFLLLYACALLHHAGVVVYYAEDVAGLVGDQDHVDFVLAHYL